MLLRRKNGTRARGLFSRRQLFQKGSLLAAGGLLGGGVPKSAAAPAPELRIGPDIYQSIGVRPLINARGTVTIVGGSKMLPEVQEAMQEAARHFVQIDELMEGVGRRLGELTGAEWGVVTAGCGAALTLATAACTAGGDPDKLARLPDLTGMKDEVVVPSSSRNVYDHSIRAAGVRIVEAGTIDAFEAALGPNTAMVMVLAGREADAGPMSLANLCAIAKRQNVPVLVDAAAEGLRVPNVHLERGASMVAYSGGKCLRGPQCAGLLLGRKNLVQAAWIHGAPHHGFARGMKVGREEIMGMLAAAESWMTRDHQAEQQLWMSWMESIANQVENVEGVTAEIAPPSGRGNRTPRLTVRWDPARIPLTGYDVEMILYNGDPRIAVSGAGSFLPFPPNMNPYITVTAYTLEAGEEQIIAQHLVDVLSKPPERDKKKAPVTNLSGRWDVHLEFLHAAGKHFFSLEQEGSNLQGTHHGEFVARDLTGWVDGDTVLVRSAYKDDGVRLSYEFGGVIRGGQMSGEVVLGEYGKARWRANRHVQQIQQKKA